MKAVTKIVLIGELDEKDLILNYNHLPEEEQDEMAQSDRRTLKYLGFGCQIGFTDPKMEPFLKIIDKDKFCTFFEFV